MPTRISAAAATILFALFATGAGEPALSPNQTAPATSLALTLPNKLDSLKFAVLGDFGTGARPQYELAAQMKRVRDVFPYELVTLVGDNLYGSQRPRDFKKKFEVPYQPLLDAGVKFYASLGNHDVREQRYYRHFNMDGKLYYTFKAKQDVRFFALDSGYMDPQQVGWLEKELKDSNEVWKIAFFHHPPYSSGDRHGSDQRLREVLEPLFLQYNVSVVFNGHDHFYERLKPQQGIVYFVCGAGGKLRKGNIDRGSGLTAAGNDTDQSFLAAEIHGDEMSFNAVSRAGAVFDSGVITRRK